MIELARYYVSYLGHQLYEVTDDTFGFGLDPKSRNEHDVFAVILVFVLSKSL